MRKGGRFGKYGEQKRFDRLRQSRVQKLKMSKVPRTGRNLRDTTRGAPKEEPKGNKENESFPPAVQSFFRR